MRSALLESSSVSHSTATVSSGKTTDGSSGQGQTGDSSPRNPGSWSGIALPAAMFSFLESAQVAPSPDTAADPVSPKQGPRTGKGLKKTGSQIADGATPDLIATPPVIAAAQPQQATPAITVIAAAATPGTDKTMAAAPGSASEIRPADTLPAAAALAAQVAPESAATPTDYEGATANPILAFAARLTADPQGGPPTEAPTLTTGADTAASALTNAGSAEVRRNGAVSIELSAAKAESAPGAQRSLAVSAERAAPNVLADAGRVDSVEDRPDVSAGPSAARTEATQAAQGASELERPEIPAATPGTVRPNVGSTENGRDLASTPETARTQPAQAIAAVRTADRSAAESNDTSNAGHDGAGSQSPQPVVGDASALLSSRPAGAAAPQTRPAPASPSPSPVPEPMREESAAPHPLRELSIRIGNEASQTADVRMVERNGEIQVAVRASDSALAHSLQSEVSDLVRGLSSTSSGVEIWQPGSPSQAGGHDASQQEHGSGATGHQPEGQDSASSGNRHGGGNNERNQAPPWLDELESISSGDYLRRSSR
jgi:hypothetical protein